MRSFGGQATLIRVCALVRPPLLARSGWSEKFRISDNGNVGIGWQTPGYKVDILTGPSNDGIMMRASSSFVIYHSPSLVPGGWNNITQGGDAGFVYGTTPTGPAAGFIIAPWMAGMTGLRLDQQGNVGICTSNTQGYQLAVNGNAICTKMVVKTYGSWPDYVFDNTCRSGAAWKAGSIYTHQSSSAGNPVGRQRSHGGC